MSEQKKTKGAQSAIQPTPTEAEANSLREERTFKTNLAIEEYKIIQGKIDKIGDFCHMVKGWSLTITAGILAGSATTSVPWWCSFGAIATTFLFAIGDDNQKQLRKTLVARAVELEGFLSESCLTGAEFPAIARQIREESYTKHRLRFVWFPPSRFGQT